MQKMYIHSDFYDRTLAPKREIDVLRARSPAGSHLQRQDTDIPAHSTYSNPRQSNATIFALRCFAAAESHHKSGHGRPSHPAQRSTRNTKDDCTTAIIHPTTDPNTRQWGPTAPVSTQRGGRDLRSISARKHGQRLQPRSAPILEAPSRSRDPQSNRSPKSSSSCRACEH